MRTMDGRKSRRIIEAAAQLFAERHYHEVRMDDVASKAGVAKGTIYLHFKDKDALYQAIALDGLRILSEKIQDSLVGLEDPSAKLLSVHREAVRYFERQPFTLDLLDRVERLQEQDGRDQEAWAEIQEGFARILGSILKEFPAAGHRGEDEIALSVLALSGMTKEVLQKLPRPWPADLPERLTRLFLGGFLTR